MLRSIAASSSWRSLWSSQWSKPQKLHRPPFEWTTESLFWYPFRWAESKATSVTPTESYGAVISSNLSTVICSLNTGLEQFVFYWSREKKLVYLYERLFDRIHWKFLFQTLYEDWKTSGKSVKLYLTNNCSLWTNVNYELWRFVIWTALILFNQSDSVNYSNTDFDRLIVTWFVRV